ncbi:MAG: hypothetical protein RL497_1972 [Pseudomonadota bacterium]
MIEQAVLQQWYGKPTWLWVFLPLVPLFLLLSTLRRCYEQARQQRLPVPVVVVGNISVGGTGKTPVIIALARQLQASGLKVGVVSRGYGGTFEGEYQLVAPSDDARVCGDEPLLLAQSLDGPVCVGRDRVAAGLALVQQGCQVILSDDGLQHYRLARDLEIILIDQSRGLGNGWCLPLGPLREQARRLNTADWVLYNGGTEHNSRFTLAPQGWRQLLSNVQYPLQPWPWGPHSRVCALAGIGNPQRFFASLEAMGLDVTAKALPDHHRFAPQDFTFAEHAPLIITAKDAVKCRSLAPENTWVLDVNAQLPEPFVRDFCARINALFPLEHRL